MNLFLNMETINYTQNEKTCLSIGYKLAYNDILKVLRQLVTNDNKPLILEILNRAEHNLNVRQQTEFLPNCDLLNP
ncbi:MAG: hypothetical protein KatS3mg035_2297 [Bacteroidia bacterium]|nr:MAG: hypothetical protein KatS3mg035_2297 [Bacteroidia bacterium]